MIEGTVKWFNESKGFGFLSREGGPDVFVHHTEIKADGFRTLNEGDRVRFEVVDSPKGPRAANVSKIWPTREPLSKERGAERLRACQSRDPFFSLDSPDPPQTVAVAVIHPGRARRV